MLKKKLSILVVLAMVFAMVFGACGEAGGADIQGPDLDDEGNPLVEGVSYKVGGEGQAGGIVFYVDPEGFEVVGYGTAYYLEAAPNDLGSFEWQSAFIVIAGTEPDIGTGRKNTELLHADGNDTPAASACFNYTGGGKDDWFLPSIDELNELYQYWNGKSRPSNFNLDTTGSYWSSTQSSYGSANVLSFNNGERGNSDKDSGNIVRAIRAF